MLIYMASVQSSGVAAEAREHGVVQVAPVPRVVLTQQHDGGDGEDVHRDAKHAPDGGDGRGRASGTWPARRAPA